jgi:cell division protein FtsQ
MLAITEKRKQMAKKTLTKTTNSSRESHTEPVHWTFWFGVVFFVSVIVGIIYGSVLITEKMINEEGAPRADLIITGEMPYTTRADVEMAVETLNLADFFSLDVNEVQKRVQALPWIYSVSVRKHWPNHLKLYIVDEKPIAQWNGDFLINKKGRSFQADISRLKSHLPQFYGPEGSEVIALENFIGLNGLLESIDVRIDELVLSERYSWQLILNDGVLLNLGREDRIDRIQRFIDVYSTIKAEKKNKQQVDYIDLRYDTGVAVGWKPNQT